MDYTDDLPQKEEMNTLMECMEILRTRGYTHNFVVKEDATILDDDKKQYGPEDVIIRNFYRFEGESDPADNAILYAIVTSGGAKGIITDSYGPTSNTHITNFISGVEEIQKKIKH